MKNILIFLAAFAALIALLNHQFPGALEHEDNHYHLLYLVVLTIVIGGSVTLSNRAHWKKNVQYAIAWVGVFLLIITGYSYRDTLLNSKLGSELIPGSTTITADDSMLLHARADGHFYISATINNHKLRFMIDTGASDIMLTKETAERIGLNIAPDAKKQIYSTANGISSGREVTIDTMQIGNFTTNNITAYVSQGNAGSNLLGMAFLNRLSGYSVEDGTMTLVP